MFISKLWKYAEALWQVQQGHWQHSPAGEFLNFQVFYFSVCEVNIKIAMKTERYFNVLYWYDHVCM